MITLSGQRVTVGQASTNLVSLKHDATISRLHAVLENLGCAWSKRDVGRGNGTYLNGERSLPNGSCVLETSCESAIHG